MSYSQKIGSLMNTVTTIKGIQEVKEAAIEKQKEKRVSELSETLKGIGGDPDKEISLQNAKRAVQGQRMLTPEERENVLRGQISDQLIMRERAQKSLEDNLLSSKMTNMDLKTRISMFSGSKKEILEKGD